MTEGEPQGTTGPVDHEPRGFVRGAGYILQIAGVMLLLGGCCLGSFSGLIQRPQDQSPASAVEWFRRSPPAQLVTAINIVISGVAGLALLVFGLGLQQERRRSGIGAMIATGLLAAGWWTTAIAAVFLHLSIMRILINVVFAVGATLLFFLAGGAERTLRLHPPPPDEPVTDEFLAQFARRRHRVEEEKE